MTLNEVLAVCKLGAEQGCKEALFTLGTQPFAASSFSILISVNSQPVTPWL